MTLRLGQLRGSGGTVKISMNRSPVVSVTVAPVATLASASQSMYRLQIVCSFCSMMKPVGSRMLTAMGMTMSRLNVVAVTADVAFDCDTGSMYSDSSVLRNR